MATVKIQRLEWQGMGIYRAASQTQFGSLMGFEPFRILEGITVGYRNRDGHSFDAHDEDLISEEDRVHNNRPSPQSDGIGTPFGLLFGFASNEQRNAWFPVTNLFALLDIPGVELVEYAVPEELVRWGKTQVAFPVEAAHCRDVLMS